MLFRQISIFAGIFILISVVSAGISLATWNVEDPSFSYATDDKTIANMLGFWGAVYADLTMQFFGLSGTIALLPPFLWATLLIFQREMPSIPRCFFFWILSIIFFSTSAFMLPISEIWPMETGPGGILGNKLVNISNIFLLTLPSHITGSVLGFLLALLSVILAVYAGGVISHRHCSSKTCVVLNDRDTKQEGNGDRKWRNGQIIILGWLTHIWIRLSFFLYFNRQKNNNTENSFLIEIKSKRTSSLTKDIPCPNEITLKHGKFTLPHIHYLSKKSERDKDIIRKMLKENAQRLITILKDFDVHGKIINVYMGPIVTLYELELTQDVKSERIISLSDNIARSMSVLSIRVEAILERCRVIRIELPNLRWETVYLREMLESREFRESEAKLCLTLGKDVRGAIVIADLAKMPHVLIAGATGSGKSVAINAMIISLIYRMSPEECRFIIIDPKMLELSVYDGIPHLLTPIVTDPKKAIIVLKWAVREMEYRYHKMARIGVHSIDCFNDWIRENAGQHGENFPCIMQTNFNNEIDKPTFDTKKIESTPIFYIVIIIGEMANLMMAGEDIEALLQRLAQMARAVGIHVIMATQHLSMDVITSTIKENFPTRIALAVRSKIESNTILGNHGAEKLLGQGDMLFMTESGQIQRVHGAFVNDSEVNRVVAHLKIHGTLKYLNSITNKVERSDSDDIIDNHNT